MPQNHSPHRYAVVSLALIDNLITKLISDGVIKAEDKAAIVKVTREGIKNPPNSDTQGAVALLDEIYGR
jgi:hypothetical protein